MIGRSRRLPVLTAALVAGVLAACGREPTQPAPPTVASVVVTPAADTLTALGQTRTLQAVAKDANGTPIPGKTFAWASAQPGVASVDPGSGLARAVANGQATITATVDGVTGQATLIVDQAVATVVVTPPSVALSALAASQQFAAVARDANSNPVPNVTFIWLSSNHNVATIDAAGLATSTGPGTVTITAAGRGIPGTATLSVTQAPRQLAFSVQPSGTGAGQAISPAIQVEVQDAAGVRVAGARDAVTLAITANPANGTLSGTRTANAVDGIATFSGLWIDKAGKGYTLAASSGSLTGATSAGFDVAPGPAAALTFTTQPPTTVQGNAPLLPAVQITIGDAFGNTVPTGTVSLTLGTAPWPGTVMSGTWTVDAVNGVATFTDVHVDKPGPGYTLLATTGGISQASRAFHVILTFSPVLDIGGNHTCAVAAAGSYCWGNGDFGQLGNFSFLDSVPAVVFGGHTFVELSAGGSHTCGRIADGTLYCWGANGFGQLGEGSTTDQQFPTAVSAPPGVTFTAVTAGQGHTCALATGGAVYCWGRNADGQLGDSSNTDRHTPTAVSVSPGLTFLTVSAGVGHSCAVGADTKTYCWGRNTSGQLGDGTKTARIVPTVVSGGLTFDLVSAGAFHTCARTGDHSLFYCWGSNGFGQLGDGTTSSRTAPVVVNLLGGVPGSLGTVTAGAVHTCGLADQYLFCWGGNTSGELGDGTTNNSSLPVAVLPSKTFDVISAGAARSCAVEQATSLVYCWGFNSQGAVGDGSTVERHQPVRVVQ